MSGLAALDSFLDSKEADNGLTERARILISAIPGDEDAAYQYFAKMVVPTGRDGRDGVHCSTTQEEAARSYRAMTMLKQDLLSTSMYGHAPVLIKNPAQAGLLAKDLFAGLSVEEKQRYSTLHIRELLDALLEAFPEKVMAAASAGGKQGIEEHLGPLMSSDQTLSVLTHLVCYGCTGRKGIASAEKSAQHTANMYQALQRNGGKSKIGMGQRKKFVRACMDFQLLDRLADTLTTRTTTRTIDGSQNDVGEEVCEAILTMIELIGYPPEDDSIVQQQQIVQPKNSKDDVAVGEDILLSPLASEEWWSKLLNALEDTTATPQQRLAIARTCTQAFALSTGNSSRICKSHAPATDATEQTSENIVQEKEDNLTNRIIEWGLTDKIHAALIHQLPLLIRAMDLPDRDILSYQGTFSIGTGQLPETAEISIIKHPGRYGTLPMGSWRLQLLSLLKEIVVYRGSDEMAIPSMAMEAIMQLPLPTEFLTCNKGEDEKDNDEFDSIVYNPWPTLCSFIWAYPYNDFYSIIFFELLRAVVIEHHEASLRVILQKSKFLTRAVKSLATKRAPQRGVLLNCLNLLRLRSMSLPPSAFLPQYLTSHDLWKGFGNQLIEMTILQQTPINDQGDSANIGLGSRYAVKLGLGDIAEFDATTLAQENAEVGEFNTVDEGEKSAANSKKKKKNTKKKKKK